MPESKQLLLAVETAGDGHVFVLSAPSWESFLKCMAATPLSQALGPLDKNTVYIRMRQAAFLSAAKTDYLKETNGNP